jgi:hypothetical protein
MPSDAEIIASVRELLQWREADRVRLTTIHDYLHGSQAHPVSPRGSPPDLIRLAKMSRVNVMKIVVNTVTQCLYVDGFRQRLEAEDAPVWDIWQENKMDRGQIGVHRAALAYGVAYATVLPGDTAPEIKGYSPRRMTAIYGEDEDWPERALLAIPMGNKWQYRLYTDTSVFTVEGEPGQSPDSAELTLVDETIEHNLGVTPVVRFLNEQDLDDDNEGEVEPLVDLQDQIDLTTFSLLVAQHYSAFRQRWILGWVAKSEQELIKSSAARILTFEDENIKIGEFEQTQLDGYINSREESLKQAASLSQTPVHELIGSLVNLSAEALVAAEAGQRRKVVERQTSFGESWELVLELASRLGGQEIDEGAEVRWRDTEDRAFSATADALVKIMSLGVPPQELWDRIPNTTKQELDRWKATAAKGSAIDQLTQLLSKQGLTDTGAGGTAAA